MTLPRLPASNNPPSKARLTSLYSDFATSKATNADGYAANASAWRSALVKASRAGVMPGENLLSFHAGEKLAKELEVRGLGRPAALGSVFVSGCAPGHLCDDGLTGEGRCCGGEADGAAEGVPGFEDEPVS